VVGRSCLSTGYPVICHDSWALHKPFLVRINENERKARVGVEGQRVVIINHINKEDRVPIGVAYEQVILWLDR